MVRGRGLRLVVFDMAGTTVDDRVDGVPLVLRSYDDALWSCGVEVPMEVLNEQRGRDKWTVIRELGGGDAEEIYSRFNAVLLANADRVREVRGASGAFRFLRRHGVKVALNTGFPREVAEAIIGHLAWEGEGLIDSWTCSEAVGRSRPDPAMIDALMRDLGVGDPSAVMKVDDTATGIEEGLNAGAVTLGVLTGTQTRERLLRARPHGILESVRDLPSYLRAGDMSDLFSPVWGGNLAHGALYRLSVVARARFGLASEGPGASPSVGSILFRVVVLNPVFMMLVFLEEGGPFGGVAKGGRPWCVRCLEEPPDCLGCAPDLDDPLVPYGVEVAVVGDEGGARLEAGGGVEDVGGVLRAHNVPAGGDVPLLDVHDVHLGDEGVEEEGGRLGPEGLGVSGHLLRQELVAHQNYALVPDHLQDEPEGGRLPCGVLDGGDEDVVIEEEGPRAWI
ncbi:HAD-IA family hydrolase [Candidatus Bathyarchaeota archaeon]|nr:HAD-IA family hydrolase [Candidatus Bathyarchaeota archaeon]